MSTQKTDYVAVEMDVTKMLEVGDAIATHLEVVQRLYNGDKVPRPEVGASMKRLADALGTWTEMFEKHKAASQQPKGTLQ